MEPNHLRLITHCPLCRVTYLEAQIRFCSDLGSAKVYHCTCLACAHAMIAVVMENSGWSSSIGMVTDLSAEDVKRLDHETSVSADDCVRFHDDLEGQTKAWCRRLLEGKTA